MSTESIHFTLSSAEYEQLCDLARERGCTVSDLAREAVRAMYLVPLRLGSRLAAWDDLLASFEEPVTPGEIGDEASGTPAEPALPAGLSRLIAGLEGGGMFAGLDEIMDSLDDLRDQLEADLEQPHEGEAP